MNDNDRRSLKHHTAMEYRRRVCLAMDFISKHIEEEIPLEEVAKAASFSSFHFHRIFKAVVGETVSAFTRRLRLELAANRLKAACGKSITEIAIECGFSSSQNFAKAFRRHFGMTPTEFKNSKQGNKKRKDENALSLRIGHNPDLSIDPGDLIDNPGDFVANANDDERKLDMNAEVKDLPEYHVAYVRKMGPYCKETCEPAFAELMQWAGPRGFLAYGTILGLYWDNPEVTPPEKCRIDACVSVPKETQCEGPINMQTVRGGPYAVCHFEVKTDSFQQCWEDAFQWLIKSGYECDDSPCYERYYNNAEEHPEGKWIFDICIPLKRK